MPLQTADVVTVTREDFYKQVWSEPMWTLAQRYGLSDIEVSKTCRKFKIPLPKRGYWQKKQAGEQVSPTLLPTLSASLAITLGTVTLPASRPSRIDQRNSTETSVETIADLPKIVVADIVRDPHPLVAHTAKTLRSTEPTREGLLPRMVSADSLDVRVSLKTIDRAMCVLDALLKSLDEYGITISVDIQGKRAVTRAHVLGEIIPFHMEERVEHVLAPPVAPPQSDGFLPRSEMKFVPTGELEFYIDVNWLYGENDVRRSWRDGTQQRIEDSLGEILLGFLAVANAVTVNRLKHEERERQWREEERQRRHGIWKTRQEKRRRDAMQAELERWRLYQELRSYVDMRRVRGVPADCDVERWGAWLDWLANHANSMEDHLARALGPEPEPFNEHVYYHAG